MKLICAPVSVDFGALESPPKKDPKRDQDPIVPKVMYLQKSWTGAPIP